MIEVGQLWKHNTRSGIGTVWEVVTEEEAYPHLLELEETGRNLFLKLLYTTDAHRSSLDVGDYLAFWNDSIQKRHGWSRIDPEDLPLIMLGAV